MLGLRKVTAEESSLPEHARREDWSAADVCEAVAAMKGWRNKRGAQLDASRAANWLMRAALAGTNGVSLSFLPPE